MSGIPLPPRLDVKAPPPDRHIVLLVDDDEDLLFTMQSALSRAAPSLSFVAARSAEEAFGILRKTTVSVIISDYRMPGENGVEFLAEVRRQFPAVHRVLMTGDPGVNLASTAQKEGGVERLFIKPVEMRRLAAACEQLARIGAHRDHSAAGHVHP